MRARTRGEGWARALCSVLFALACLLAPLQTAFPSGTGEGHHHVLSHTHHHERGELASNGGHEAEPEPAPDQDQDPSADQDSAGHSHHPVHPGMLTAGERQPWAAFSVPIRRKAASARAGPSLPSAPPSRPPNTLTISV